MLLWLRWSYLCFILATLPTFQAAPQLDKEAFESLTKSGKNGMIKFYQPWCSHCTRMKPDWDKLADAAHPSVFIADVNCTEEQQICFDNAVSGYPTIKVFKSDGKVEDYHGPRGFDDLLDFVTSKLADWCNVAQPSACSEKAQKYIAKWQAKLPHEIEKEVSRLSATTGDQLAPKLKEWFAERLQILRQL